MAEIVTRKAWRCVLAILATMVISPACSSPTASELLEPLWTVDVGERVVNSATVRAGYADGAIAFSVPVGMQFDRLLANVEEGALSWSKQLPMAGELAVSENGRIHYLDYPSGTEVHRVEGSGTELSSLGVGFELAYLVAAHDTSAIVVQYATIGAPYVRAPKIISASAANTVQWERVIDIGGRCLYADILRAEGDLVVVGGREGEMVNGGCGTTSESRIWLAAISAVDGSLLWSQVASPSGIIRDLAVADDFVVVVGSFGRQALRIDGTELWWTPEPNPNCCLTGVEIISPSRLVAVEGDRVKLIDAADGTETGDVYAVPEARDGRVFFDGLDTLYFAGRRTVDPPSAQPAVAALRVAASVE